MRYIQVRVEFRDSPFLLELIRLGSTEVVGQVYDPVRSFKENWFVD